jgi:membrane fusion protein, adhesin transport system
VATTFSRTTRALGADGFGRWAAGLAIVAVLLVVWTAWFAFARVRRIEVSQDARVEVEQAVRRIEPVVEGRIVTSHLVLGREVARGDVLVEIDATPQVLEQVEAKGRAEALGPEVARIREEIAAETRALDSASAAARSGLGQARAEAREAAAAAENARQDADRLRRLHEGGIVSDGEYQRGRSEAERRIAAGEALELAVARLGGEQQAQESERRARIESLQRQITRLEGEAATLRATADRLENEIERRSIRAVVAGTLADVAAVQPGAIVAPGQPLGTILPSGGGELKIVAHFRPSEALGRVQPGQAAQVRLDGFPWMQYGSVAAEVTHVAGEIRDGLVRVDLAIAPGGASPIPLQHGLPGVVEIEVERLTPAVLALRAAGQLLTRPVTSRVSAQAPAS